MKKKESESESSQSSGDESDVEESDESESDDMQSSQSDSDEPEAAEGLSDDSDESDSESSQSDSDDMQSSQSDSDDDMRSSHEGPTGSVGAMLECIAGRDWERLPHEVAAFSDAVATSSGSARHYEDLFVGIARAFRGLADHPAQHESTDAELRVAWREDTLPADPALKLLAFCHYMSCD